jgi:hypothetical protein
LPAARHPLIAFVVMSLSLLVGHGASPAGAQALDKTRPQMFTRDGASLRVYTSERVLHFTPAATADAATSARTLADLLSAMAGAQPGASYRLGFGRYSELNARMAALAACSPEWDARVGRPETHAPGPWLRRALADHLAYRELVEALRPAGWRVSIASVESVLLCLPAEIDWTLAPRPCAQAPAESARLPCGALITFELTAP